MTSRTGIGVDAHPLVEGRPLVLGGVVVPYHEGLLGHSDGDVLTHAVIDALLGAAGLGDIGTHFPSSDPRYKGAESTALLRDVVARVEAAGWKPRYLDATILAEKPALLPHMDRMKGMLAGCMGLDPDCVNLKAKTTDGLGFTGRGEGIAALAVATMDRIE